MTILQFRADLPWSIGWDDIERLRGLGAVDLRYTVEGISRREVIQDLSAEMRGWREDLENPDWWARNLSRGRRVS